MEIIQLDPFKHLSRESQNNGRIIYCVPERTPKVTSRVIIENLFNALSSPIITSALVETLSELLSSDC